MSIYLCRQVTGSYDLSMNVMIATCCFTVTMLLMTFMISKNHEGWSLHTCIGLISLILVYKLFQLSLIGLWMTYVILCLYGIQLYVVGLPFYSGWGTWCFLLVTYFAVPLMTLCRIFLEKPVITTVFDNDLSALTAMNVIYCGIGYIVGQTINMNYLGYWPLIVMGLLTALLTTFPLIGMTSRKDETNVQNEVQ